MKKHGVINRLFALYTENSGQKTRERGDWRLQVVSNLLLLQLHLHADKKIAQNCCSETLKKFFTQPDYGGRHFWKNIYLDYKKLAQILLDY